MKFILSRCLASGEASCSNVSISAHTREYIGMRLNEEIGTLIDEKHKIGLVPQIISSALFACPPRVFQRFWAPSQCIQKSIQKNYLLSVPANTYTQISEREITFKQAFDV